MAITPRRGTARSAWPWIGSILTAVSLAALLVAPTLAAPLAELRDGRVYPGSGGDTRTVWHIRVTFEDDADERPDYVRVVIGGTNHVMDRDYGHDWDRGVVYEWHGRLPDGAHDVVFEARTDAGDLLTLGHAAISVEAVEPDPTPVPTPDPTPVPTPDPTPDPTPKPAPKPTPKPAATPRPTAEPATRGTDRPAGDPDPKPTAAPVAAPSATATTEPDPGVGPTSYTAFVWPSLDPAASVAPEASPSPSPTLVAALPPDGGEGGPTPTYDPSGDGSAPLPDGLRTSVSVGSSWGPLTSIVIGLGLSDGSLPVLPLMPTVMTSSGVAVSAMALGLFGRRRRDEDQPEPDAVLAAHAAEGIGVGHGAADGIADAGPRDDGDPDAFDEDAEALLPRWRRPSLLQARRADPLRTSAQAPRLTFDAGFSGALGGRERRQIRYTVVRLLDSPDELRGNEIGVLGDGDEVELLERQGSYWLVACPDGGRGWVHKMTLGTEMPETRPHPGDAPSASIPLAADTWTMGEADIDDDVLQAYLASRQRRD